MTRGGSFVKDAKCSHGHRSALSNSAWCDLHDMCHNPKCRCKKQITFTPKQFHIEGGSIKSKLQNFFKGKQTAWNKFLKPAVNVAAPFIGMAVSAKTKNPKVGAATTIIKKINFRW